MNKFIRIAALGLAIGIVGAVMSGCGSDKYAEQYDVLSESSKKTLAIKNGSLVIDENITIPKDIKGILESSASYTQITYTNDGKLEYQLTKYDSADKDRSEPYKLFTSSAGVFESRGDEKPTEYKGEAPGVLEYLMLDFKLEDVKKIDVEIRSTDTLYTVTTNAAYADKFDTQINGGEYDCTAVEYVYSIDRLNKIKSVNTEYTADFTYKGETQETVRTVKASFTENSGSVNTTNASADKEAAYKVISSGIEKVTAAESASLIVDKKVATDREIADVIVNSEATESVSFTKGDEIGAYIGADCKYEEIDRIDIMRYPAESGNGYQATRYIVTMLPVYADKYDNESDSVKCDCYGVEFTYYIDVNDGLTQVTKELKVEYTVGKVTADASKTETVTITVG